ncbi:paeninodin family lasso peptide [Paenisporosarcina sp. TG-14]|nr:paeninodin family lasso peptide [Paenisporosarcina sp. TG-14]
MKKQWKKPELEVLEVNMTMGGDNGEYPDAASKGGFNNRKTES